MSIFKVKKKASSNFIYIDWDDNLALYLKHTRYLNFENQYLYWHYSFTIVCYLFSDICIFDKTERKILIKGIFRQNFSQKYLFKIYHELKELPNFKNYFFKNIELNNCNKSVLIYLFNRLKTHAKLLDEFTNFLNLLKTFESRVVTIEDSNSSITTPKILKVEENRRSGALFDFNSTEYH